jgi:type IV secretory pathway TraG/TraD family ATPase VirD4
MKTRFDIGQFVDENGRKHDVFLPQSHHITVCGATGLFKTSSMFLPNVLGDQSKVLFDFKNAEILRKAGDELARLGPLFVTAPHGLDYPLPRAARLHPVNPMKSVNDAPPDMKMGEAEKLSANLFPTMESDGGNHNHFATSAQSVLNHCQVGISIHGKPDERNIPFIANALHSFPKEFCKRMIATGDQRVAHIFTGYLAELKKIKTSFDDVMLTVKNGLREFLNPTVGAAMSGDGGFEMLGSRCCTYMLVEKMTSASHSQAAALYFTGLMNAIQDPRRSLRVPIRVMVDEAHALKCPAVPLSYRISRSANCQIVTYWNDLTVMRQCHPDANSLLANGSQVFIGGSKDWEAAEHVSRMSGVMDALVPNTSVHYDASGIPSANYGKGVQSIPVLSPGDFLNLSTRQAACIIRGVPGVVVTQHSPYFERFWMRRKFK